MTIQVLIAHAEGEENYAEELARPIRDAGYEVVHDGTVMVGESRFEEASKVLMAGGAVVICGTIKAAGTRWARHLVDSARTIHQEGKIFPVRVEQEAYIEQLALDIKPVEYWQNSDKAMQELIVSLEKYYPLDNLNKVRKQPHVPFMVEDLPGNFVERPDVFEPLIRCLLDEKREEPVAITAALRGAGGYGKTTLARALCHDKRVQQAFDDGILWVTFGERPGNLVNKIEELLYTLNREKPGYTSLDAATTRLVELLADRKILLVLDDVWNDAHIKPFLQGGKRCARLITTRDERVVALSVPLDQRIQVDAMQQDEAIQLLISGIQVLEEPALLNHHYTKLKRLATRLGEWPILLMLVKSVLQVRINLHKQDVDHAITAIHHALDKRGVTAFDHTNPVERSQAVGKTLEVSFELLRPEERARYQEFVIFPEDVDIPLQTLQRLWGKTGNLDEFDTEDLCMRFWNLSLLLHYNSVTQTVQLHDVIRNYLQYQRTRTELAQLHTRFLDAYAIKRWADLPQHEPYLWDHLATHLIAADRTSELVTIVTDGAYLASKGHYRPVSLLEQDLELAMEHNPDNPVLSHLQRSISNMTPLHSCETWQECASVLHSRLVLLPEFRPICQSLEHRFKQPYLTTWHPLPDLPTDALKRTLFGHTNWVNACAISPDGTWLLSASDDGTLRIWDASSGKLRHTLTDHTKGVGVCAISPNGEWFLSASDDGTLNIWDVPSGMIRRTFTNHVDKITACAISPDGYWLHTVSDNGTLRIWDIFAGKIRHTLFSHTKGARACATSPDGTWLLTASDDGTLNISNIFSGKISDTFTCDTKGIRACAISPDGTWLLTASDDDTLMTWDAFSGQLRHILTGHTRSVNACVISPDGKWLLSASRDRTLRIWDTPSEELRYTLTSHTKRVRACAISPDSTWLLSSSDDHTLRIWDVNSGKIRRTLTRHSSWVVACAISPDGTWLLSASLDNTLRIWDAASGSIRHTLPFLSSGNACAISPDGTWLLSASYHRALAVWDVLSGRRRYTLAGHTSSVNACAISLDGTWLLSASRDCTLRIWDALSGQLRHILTGHTKGVRACAISPDGKWLLSASDDHTLRIWDALSGQLRHTLRGHTSSVNACAISPDGTWLLSASDDHALKIWDAVTKVCIATLRVNGALQSCLFCGDRYHIVAGGESGVYFLRVVVDE